MRRARPDTPRNHRLRRRHGSSYRRQCEPDHAHNVNQITHNVNREMHASERDEATAAHTVRQRRKLIGRLEVIITQADRK